MSSQDGQGDPRQSETALLSSIDARLTESVRLLQQAVEALGTEPTVDPRNFIIRKHDLNKRDWVLTDQKGDQFAGRLPNFQGADVVSFFIESDDDRQFDVLVRNLTEKGNVHTEIDQNIDAELRSTSPGGANHYIFVTVDISDKWTDVAVTTVNTGNPNRIKGSINFH